MTLFEFNGQCSGRLVNMDVVRSMWVNNVYSLFEIVLIFTNGDATSYLYNTEDERNKDFDRIKNIFLKGTSTSKSANRGYVDYL